MPTEVLLAVGASIVTLAIAVVVLVKARVRIDSGQALVISPGRVSFNSALVIPLVQHAETIDIRRKTIRISRRGKESLSCRDGIRVDVVVDFDIRINQTAEDVLKVATTIGTARASDPDALRELFAAKFIDALAAVTKYVEFEQLDEDREKWRDQVMSVIGLDLDGFVLDGVSVVALDQTPIEQLDADNVLDAKGIAKIKELTTRQRMDTARRESECQELLMRLELQEREALSRVRDATGHELRREDLQRRLDDRLRELIRDEIDA